MSESTTSTTIHFLESRCERESVIAVQSLSLCANPQIAGIILRTEEPGMSVLTASRWSAASESLVQGSDLTGKSRAEMSFPTISCERFSRWIGWVHKLSEVFISVADVRQMCSLCPHAGPLHSMYPHQLVAVLKTHRTVWTLALFSHRGWAYSTNGNNTSSCQAWQQVETMKDTYVSD